MSGALSRYVRFAAPPPLPWIPLPIRILATDLDGTLLGPDRRVSSLNQDAVRRCVEAGIEVVIASGRNSTGVSEHAEQLGLVGPQVCCNGAHVLRRPGEELSHRSLPSTLCRALVQMASERGLHLHFYSRARLVFLTKDSWGELYLGRLAGIRAEYLAAPEALSIEVTKAMFVGGAEEIASLHREALETDWADPAELTLSEKEYLEFLPKGTNKGTGVQAIAQELGVSRHEVAAIGDYLNDLPMLEWAGVSGAVGNAAPAVKACADVVVGTNEAGGVAQFIDSYVLNQRE